tara:strand:+ start:6486 stop:6755 length:270 start_codon:yes stop_codon:yes gene_type:complete
MSEYKRLKGAKTVLAICIAEGEEIYHHWQVFSRGLDGVNIQFDKAKLLTGFDAAGGNPHPQPQVRPFILSSPFSGRSCIIQCIVREFWE